MLEKQQTEKRLISRGNSLRLSFSFGIFVKLVFVTLTFFVVTTSAQEEKFVTIPTADAKVFISDAEDDFSFGAYRPFTLTVDDYFMAGNKKVFRYSMCLIKNSGTNGKGWWWYTDQTVESLASKIEQFNARIISLYPYRWDSSRFAAVLVPNTGANNKAWWWYFNVSPAHITSKLNENNARLIDIHQSGNGLYTVVMIANTGTDQKVSSWGVGKTVSEIQALVTLNNGRLIRVAPEGDVYGESGSWDYIMVAADGKQWAWYPNKTEAELNSLATANKARFIDLEIHNAPGSSFITPKYSAILLKE